MKLITRFVGFLTVLMVITLTGCGSNPGWYKYHSVAKTPSNVYSEHTIWPIYLDTSFTNDEVDIIGKTVNEWNVVLNGQARFMIAEKRYDHTNHDQVRELIKIIGTTYQGLFLAGCNEDEEFASRLDIESGDGVLGLSDALGAKADLILILRDRLGTRSLHKLLLHEMGHVAGSTHTGVAGLMYPLYSDEQYDCVDYLTMLYVAKNRGFDPKYMNYCRTPLFE